MPDVEVTATVFGRLIVQAGRTLDGPFSEVLARYSLTRNASWFRTELYRTRGDEVVTIGHDRHRTAGRASDARTPTGARRT